jgi:hypothetical protein
MIVNEISLVIQNINTSVETLRRRKQNESDATSR